MITNSDKESIRLIMSLSWKDHLDTRMQTWKSLQIEAILAAGLVGVQWQIGTLFATSTIAVLVMLASYFGARISIHHREVMQNKFYHINRCEQALNLIGENNILHDIQANVKPSSLKLLDAFNFNLNNTAVYILRMHITIFVFALVFLIARIIAEVNL